MHELIMTHDDLRRALEKLPGLGLPSTNEKAWEYWAGDEDYGTFDLNPRQTPFAERIATYRRSPNKPRALFASSGTSWGYYSEGPGQGILETYLSLTEHRISRENVTTTIQAPNLWQNFFDSANFFSEGTLPSVIITTNEVRIHTKGTGSTHKRPDRFEWLAKTWDLPLVILPAHYG